MSGAVVPFLQIGNWEALSLLAELGRRSLEMPMPGRLTCFLLCVCVLGVMKRTCVFLHAAAKL